jgi:DNA polymerase-1
MGPARLALDACTARGLPIAAQPVSVARAAFDLQLETQLGRVRALAGEGHNPNATRQVADELKRRGFELPLTKTGQAQVDKRILKELAHGDEYAAAMLGYREAQKKLSTYVRPYEEILRDDGRAHSRYTIWRTVTNRTSSSGPNVQNLDRALKDFFDAVSYDYKAIEFRIAAWLAGETSILTRYAEDADWDPHRFFASHLYGKHEEAVTKNERQVAKSANFALLYLGNGQTLYEYCRKQGILLSRAECDKIYRVWHRTFPGFARFYKQTLTELERDGYVESATGYRRHFGDFSLLRGEARREALRQAVNMKVQTLACHVALIGLAACWRRDLPVCGFIHDAVLFDMPGSTALAKHDEIRYALTVEPIEVLKDRFNITLDVPLVVESNLED